MNRELLFLYWSGLATPMQRKLIVDWLQEPIHQEKFYEWLIEWEELHPQAIANTEKAWASVNSPVNAGQSIRVSSQPQPMRAIPTRRMLPHWWMVAASLVLVAGLGFVFRHTLLWNTYQTGFGEISTVLLPDGSRATLNANSTLRVPTFFLPFGDRSIQLMGEADFSIKHQSNDQRFVVQTSNKINVVVLGTEFVVTDRSRQFRVALHTGKVVLQGDSSRAKPLLTLKPGDVASMSTIGRWKLCANQPTRQLTEWKNYLFVFDHHSISEVLTMLNEQFGETILLENDSLASYQITGRFRAKRAEELLVVITELTGSQIVVRNNQKYLVN